MGNKDRRKDKARLRKREEAFDSINQTQLNLRGRGLEMHRPGSLRK